MGQLPFTMGGFYSSLAYVIFIRLQYFLGQFWLQIVGTFQAETDEEIAYGLVHPLASWDPIWTQVRTFTGTKHLIQTSCTWFDLWSHAHLQDFPYGRQ